VKIRIGLIAMIMLTLAACGNITGDSVARYDSATLTRKDLDARIVLIENGLKSAPQSSQLPSKLDIEQQIVGQFINQQIVFGIAKQRGVAVTDKEIDAQIDTFKVQIPQATGGTLDAAIQNQLGLPGATSTEFRQFVSFFLVQEKVSATLVTTDTIRATVTEQVMAQAKTVVQKATVAHILVATEDEAKKVIERLDKGEDFGALAKELSQDPGSKDTGGIYENVTPGQFVPEFDQAMFTDLKPGETTKVAVKTQFGYHVIKLISRETGPTMTDEEAKLQIEQQIPQALQQARATELQKLIDAEKAKATTEKRIQEPIYPTPTPGPAPGSAPGVVPPGQAPPATTPVAAP
jgi:parvulin-like peptidyl-prolyl isomerase